MTLKLPDGWTQMRVDQVGSVRLGRQRSPDKHSGQHTTPYIRAANITPGGLDLSDVLEMDFTPEERAIFVLQKGDCLLTEASGSASQVGRAALWADEIPGCCFQNTVIRFRPHAVISEYALIVFRYFAASGVFAGAARGVGIQHLGGKRFAELAFPLPPLAEQRRIAETADTRLAEIREAEARLRSALAHLDEQVPEILAAAVGGELVDQNASKPAERPKVRSARKRDGRSSQPSLFDDEDVASAGAEPSGTLPEGWRWRTIGEAGEVTLGRQRAPQHAVGPHMRPYLRVANVYEDRIDTSDVLQMNFDPKEVETYALESGDILLNEGQSPELVGRAAIYRGEVPGACFQNTLIRFRASPAVNTEYALLVFRHYLHAGIFRQIAKWSTNIAHLGVERFRSLRFPLPPMEEQERIVGEAKARLASRSAQSEAIKASLDRLPEMEQELFAAAVAGELVKQDDREEPAKALLARLGPPREPALAVKRNRTRKEKGAMPKRGSTPRDTPVSDLALVVRGAGRPLRLTELFGLGGYDRDQPEHVELFYLALRSQLGRSLRKVGESDENAVVEVIDAP